ncbi:MAG TPA: cereblon family protein [Myxococcota bacterium]|nr:cereblon family protein [Myxococcota bacterium]
MDERTRWPVEPMEIGVDEAEADEAEADEPEGVSPPPPLMCGSCFAVVTSHDEAIAVAGDHAHRCVNPAGALFDIRCFREARGLLSTSAPETWFSWFSGFAWETVVCQTCRHHLGWRFTGPSTFYGLIGSALSERRSAA